jgi:hypothetical protein
MAAILLTRLFIRGPTTWTLLFVVLVVGVLTVVVIGVVMPVIQAGGVIMLDFPNQYGVLSLLQLISLVAESSSK